MYKVKLNQFEGPLDLLLFFIKRDELNIYDIPIARLTKEFLEYVNLLKILDLEIAGDFILMASTLMHIKVRMLLPREVDEKGEEIDPRADLVKALLEYKRYKEMSEELSYFESNQRKRKFRGNFSEDIKEAPNEYNILLKNVSIYDLAKAFKYAIEQIKIEPVHEIQKLNVSIEEQIEFIENKLKEFPELHFLKLVEDLRERIRIIVTFIALLEMVKVRRLDGLPLAIELAAARVGTLGLRAVRDKLDARFKLLTGGARTTLRRHPTLRAALEWSYGLLNEAERLVFRRLGVFAGGFTMELAQSVAGDDELDEWAVLDHMSAWSTSRWSWPTLASRRATACSSPPARSRSSSWQRVRPPMP